MSVSCYRVQTARNGDYKGVMGDMNCGFRGTDRQKIEVVCI